MADPNAMGPRGRSFAQVQAEGNYLDDAERYWFLNLLRADGVNLGADARTFLAQYEGGQQQAAPTAGTQPTIASSTTGGNAASGNAQAIAPQPGSDYTLLDMELSNARYIAELNNRTAAERDAINNAHDAQVKAAERELSMKLQQGEINSNQFMQARELAQQESQFARDLALRALQEEHDHNVKQAQTEIARAAEMRQERELQAQLAANPADTVAYEFYKRSLGEPEAWDTAQQFAAGQQQQSQAPANPLDPQNPTQLGGEPYAAAPPAYSDESYQELLGSIYGTQAPQWDPNLSGTGAFNTQISAPNKIGRRLFRGFSPTDLGVLTSFLRAGVQRKPGQDNSRVSINPEDYWTQAQRSFVPTLSSVGSPTQYS